MMKELTIEELYTLDETIARDIFEGVTSVSYTHLDVYKRQRRSSFMRGNADCKRIYSGKVRNCFSVGK